MTTTDNNAIPAELLAIAEHLGFPTLETRRSDALDIREVAVWQVREALQRAYEAGCRSASASELAS